MNDPVKAQKVNYFKLGIGSAWAEQCISEGTLRFGYENIPHDLCIAGRWDEVRQLLDLERKSGSATDALREIMEFYQAPSDVMWIIIHGDRMFWSFAAPQVELLSDMTKVRKTINGWSDKNIKGELLTKAKLSGELLAVEGYRKTICAVKIGTEYVLHKINGTNPNYLIAANSAYEQLELLIEKPIRSLYWADFEVLVSNIFQKSGWTPISAVGKTQKDIDLELESPVTGERIAIQVKARASVAQYLEYKQRFLTTSGYSRFYFVSHSEELEDSVHSELRIDENRTYHFWSGKTLSRMAIRSGLAQWILDKAG